MDKIRLMRHVAALLTMVLVVGIGSAGPASASTHGMQNGEDQSLCLDIQGGSTASGATAIVKPCSGSPTQTWHVRATTSVTYGPYTYLAWQLENGAGKCLGVAGSITVNTPVDQENCNSTSDFSQVWVPEGTWGPFASDPGDGWYWLSNKFSGWYLSIRYPDYTNGSPVVQTDASNSDPREVWYSVSTL